MSVAIDFDQFAIRSALSTIVSMAKVVAACCLVDPLSFRKDGTYDTERAQLIQMSARITSQGSGPN